jgi:hypothetical protein
VEHIEPFYNWRDYYVSEEDEKSPFFEVKYNEFYYDKSIYNFLIHPQWDDFGSETLYVKILFADYDNQAAILEFIGEWNDCITNDIALLKRDVIDAMLSYGINKFVLIGENVLNFHFDGDDYYQEWFEDVENGWIALLNFQEHVKSEMIRNHLDYYICMGGELDDFIWRTYKPEIIIQMVDNLMQKRLNS